MELEHTDVSFLIEESEVENPNKLAAQDIRVDEDVQPPADSDFNDLSYIVFNTLKKVSNEGELEPENEPEDVTIAAPKQPEEQIQFNEFSDTIEEPLILSTENEGENIEVVDIKPPQEPIQNDFSSQELEEPLVLSNDPNSGQDEVEQKELTSESDKESLESEIQSQDIADLYLSKDLESETTLSDSAFSSDSSEDSLILSKELHPKEEYIDKSDSTVGAEDSSKQSDLDSLSKEVEEPFILPQEPNPKAAEFQLHEKDEDDFMLDVEDVTEQVASESVSNEVEQPLILPQESSPKKWDLSSEKTVRKAPGVNFHDKTVKQNIFTTSIPLVSLFENSQLLGLDIGTRTLKYIILKKTARGIRLVDCVLRPIPTAPVDASSADKKTLITDLLRTQIKSRVLKNTLVTSVVTGMEVLFLNIRVPKLSGKELDQAVRWTCKKDIPFPIESTVIDYRVKEKSDKKSDAKLDVFVIAAQEEFVSNHLDILKTAHINPVKVSTVPVALVNLFKALVKRDTDRSYAIIDIGAESSHIVFMNQGQLQFTREITTAGEEFTEALVGSIFVEGKEITVDRERAEQIKKQYGFPDESGEGSTTEGIPLKEISVVMRPILERLLNNIQRTIDFYKEKFRVHSLEKVFLSGGGALLKNLRKNLSHELNLGVEILNPFEIMSTKKITNTQDLERMAPRFAVAVGLALDRKKTLNLLPKDMRSSHFLQIFKKVFRYLFVIILLAIILYTQNLIRNAIETETQIKTIKQEYKEFEPKRRLFVALQAKLEHLKAKNKIYESEIEIDLKSSNHLRAVSHWMPKNIALTSLRIEHRYEKVKDKKDEFIEKEILVLQGVAFADNSMEGINLVKLLLAVQKSDYFVRIKLINQKIRQDSNLEFTLECEI